MIHGVGWSLLTAAQAGASAKLLAVENAKRTHLVVSLSGAHAYGFPSPDSDVDLKSVHIVPTERLVGLEREGATKAASRVEWIDGVEIDYSSNEIGPVLAGVIEGNGNYLERLVGAAPMESDARLASLQPVVMACVSKKFYRHYRGFAHSQRVAFDEKPTAKRALYVLRTALTGTHLLRTGRLVVDVREVLDAYGFGDARALIEAKTRGEQSVLDADVAAAWRARVERVFEVIDEAHRESALPEEAPHEAVRDVEAGLLRVRIEGLKPGEVPGG